MKSHRRIFCTSNISYRRFCSSVNDEEVKKFSKLGKRWWDPSSNSGAGPLHDLNPIRIQFISEELRDIGNKHDVFESKLLLGLSILDVGCGGGLLSESLSRLGARVTGIDPSKENIAVARLHADRDRITKTIDYKNTTIEELSNTDRKFDVICAFAVPLSNFLYPLKFTV